MALDAHARQPRRSGREQASEQQELSAVERLQLAMERHAALHDGSRPIAKPHAVVAPKSEMSIAPQKQEHLAQSQLASSVNAPHASSSVAALAEQLQSLWRHQSDATGRPAPQDTPSADEELTRGNAADEDDDNDRFLRRPDANVESAGRSKPSSSLLGNALLKIGSDEKDELLEHLLQQVALYRSQLGEVATLGETIAAQLVHQQHELRLKHREQVESLEQQLHEAVHFHPRVRALEQKLDELEEASREKDQQLRFAVQKLQRSRRREKELKAMQDPLWDI